MDDRVALAASLTVSRNEAVLPFPHVADEETLRAFRARVEDLLMRRGTPGEWEVFDMDTVSPTRRTYLVERGLMTPGFSRGEGPARAIGLFQGGRAAIEINGSDHLRMLGVVPADRLSEAWATLDSIDDMLESEIAYAFDERWGYLTARAADSGTGLHAFVTLHIPGLMITGRLAQIASSLVDDELVLAPLWNGAGGVFQVFNRRSGGTSEGRITEAVAHASQELVDQEREVRQRFLEENPVVVRDHIGRALGVAQHAWSVSSPEALMVVSSIQVGASLDLIAGSGLGLDSTLQLMRRIQPAHVAIEELGTDPADLDDPQIDEARARLLRRVFAEARVV